MADNGNRGPNDPFRRSGKRRREPPIIDAAATEVPVGQATSENPPDPDVSDATRDHPLAAADETAPAEIEEPAVVRASAGERDAVTGDAADEPVLFGSAMRDPVRQAEMEEEPSSTASGMPPEIPAAEAVASSGAAEPIDPVGIGSSPADDDGERPPPPDPAPVMPPPPPSGSNTLAGIFGVAAVILLGIVGWLVYSGGQRSDDLVATVADLKTQVATLAARPDPTPLQSQMGALDKRVAAAESDRGALGKQVAALTARIDSAGQPAPASGASNPGASPPNAKPDDAASSPPPAAGQPASAPPSAAPVLATAAMVATLALKVEGIDGRVTALAGDQNGTAAAVAALPKPVPPDFGPVDAKVAGLETLVNAVDAKINGSDARLNGFDAKINGIDAKVNGFGSTMNGMTVRMNGLEAKIDDGAEQISKLKSDLAELPKVDLGPLQAANAASDTRITKVEGELAAPKDGARVTEARAVGTADETKATPIALLGQAIQQAIAMGKPYAPEIDALKALGADPKLVARLGPAAAGGAPSLDALTAQWNGTRDAVLGTLKPVAPGAVGALNRFLASATSVVQVHQVGAAPGDDTGALVSQIDAALGQGDVATALAAWDKLSAAGQAASQGWADAAKSRVDALAAAGDLVQGAIATLGRSPS